jgi:hypothetical protein
VKAFRCVPAVKPPEEAPLTEVPATPLVQMLEQRRQNFQSLKAVSFVQVVRKGRRLAFENVGILIKSYDRLRIEAYSPLGPPLIELVWDGSEVYVRRPGEPVLRKSGSGLERILGADVEPRELCAVLSGNLPELAAPSEARAFCGDEECMLEVRQGELLRRFRLKPPAGEDVRLSSYELYRAEALVFRARYEGAAPIADNPARNAGLTVVYEDVEVNVPVDDGAFTLTHGEGEER